MTSGARPSAGSIKPHRRLNKEPGYSGEPRPRSIGPLRLQGPTVRGVQGERQRKRGRRRTRGALLLDNLFSYRASSRLRLDKCSDGYVCGVKIAGVGWWSAGGGETGRGREGEMDHPVLGCIMRGKKKKKREAEEPN